MCGICGYVNTDRRPVEGSEILKGMMDAIVHRGPDDEGFYVRDNVALGHRRLSIIDLNTGHQPIFSEDKSLSIVYNGEVYNFIELKTELINRGHKFFTHSDTEVVLKAYKEWGPGCLERFNGMFSLAIWDERNKSLFLARDRFGKKPLYYAAFANTFIFGSELKSIFKHPSVKIELDRLALAKYLAYDYIPNPGSIVKGVYKLEPGHYLILKDGNIKKERFWDFRFDIGSDNKLSLKDTKHSLVELLRESVRKRLISDVPLGVFLSGGIDSSAIVAMMSGIVEPKDIKTFSIGFEEKGYSETNAARLVADHFGTDHHEKIVSAKTMLDVMPDIINTLDEPFADSSIIPTYVVSRFTREFVTVALGGDAGDELFMGYPSFKAYRIAELYDRIPHVGRAIIKAVSRKLPGKGDWKSLPFKLNRFLSGMDLNPAIRHQRWIGSIQPEEQRHLFAHGSDERFFAPENIYSESISHYNMYPKIDGIDKIDYLYMKTYLADDILTKVDRASMAVSLEVRAPFLDKDLVRFVGTIPSNLKLKGFTSKYILKEALRGILPNETLFKPKHGFAVPISRWFRRELKDLLINTFNKDKISRQGIFNHDHIEKLLDGHFSGKIDNGRKIWSLFVFQKWHDKWMR